MFGNKAAAAQPMQWRNVDLQFGSFSHSSTSSTASPSAGHSSSGGGGQGLFNSLRDDDDGVVAAAEEKENKVAAGKKRSDRGKKSKNLEKPLSNKDRHFSDNTLEYCSKPVTIGKSSTDTGFLGDDENRSTGFSADLMMRRHTPNVSPPPQRKDSEVINSAMAHVSLLEGSPMPPPMSSLVTSTPMVGLHQRANQRSPITSGMASLNLQDDSHHRESDDVVKNVDVRERKKTVGFGLVADLEYSDDSVFEKSDSRGDTGSRRPVVIPIGGKKWRRTICVRKSAQSAAADLSIVVRRE